MITAAEYLDEVKLRLWRNDVVTDGNDQLLMTLLNKARREVQMMTLDLFPERYGKVATLALANTPDTDNDMGDSYIGYKINTYRVGLPNDLIDIMELIIGYVDSSSGITYRSQARRLEKQEYWNVLANSFNAPLPETPIYTLEYTITPAKTLLIAGLNWDSGGTDKTLWDISSSVDAEIWYTAVIDDIEVRNATGVTDQEEVIPPDVEELVVVYCMYYFLQTQQKGLALNSIKQEIELLLNILKLNHSVKQKEGGDFLPTKEPLQGVDYGNDVGTANRG